MAGLKLFWKEPDIRGFFKKKMQNERANTAKFLLEEVTGGVVSDTRGALHIEDCIL